MSGSGLSALIRIGAQLENDLNLETLNIGRSADGRRDYAMGICGRFLAFTITLHGDELRVAASSND